MGQSAPKGLIGALLASVPPVVAREPTGAWGDLGHHRCISRSERAKRRKKTKAAKAARRRNR